MDIAAILTFFHALWAVPMLLLSASTRVSSNISQFEVHSLPDTPSLPLSWAGRFPVPGTENGNALFFWLFQAEDPLYDENLIIWFNGGPGCSSLIGLTTGNGPILFDGNSTHLFHNPYSWTKLGHVLFVDQPVGTGYSTASNPYPVPNNDRVTSDFYKWLQSFFSHFPHLRSKRLHLIGESYAGIYIPYFASAIVANQDSFPINLRSISLGDGTLGNSATMITATIGTFLRSQSTLLQIPDEILSAFTEADELCGFDTILEQENTFPPKGIFKIPGDPAFLSSKRRCRQLQLQRRNMEYVLNGTCNIQPATTEAVLSSILNSSCYGPCATFTTALDYLETVSSKKCYNVYDISDNCDTVDSLPLLASYFSRLDVQAALNIMPSSSSPGISFTPCNGTILDTLLSAVPPIPPAYSILPTLVTSHNISLHVYSGEYDMLLNHFGTELCLQNMTWCGAQGFSQKPSRTFFSDDAAPTTNTSTPVTQHSEAGIWTSERGVTYHLFWGAGHSVFVKKPREMFTYVRDVVIAGG